MQKKNNAAQLFVDTLVAAGVKYVFCVPGEEILALLEALRCAPIELIILHHEQVAGFMAANLGRLSGQPGVCLSTLGPGATNLVTAVAYAQLGGMPMLVLTGQKPIKNPEQGRFQVIDVVNMMRPITKHTQQLVHVGNIPAVVRSAIEMACAERPGVVHLELPEDVMGESCSCASLPIELPIQPWAAPEQMKQVVTYLHQAKHPLLIIGAAAVQPKTVQALRSFFKRVPIPFITTQMGKGGLDEHHSLYLGTTALSSGDFLHCALKKTDLVLSIGHNTTEKPPFLMKQGGAMVVHIDTIPAATHATYFPQLEVVGDIAATMRYLGKHTIPQKTWNFTHFGQVKEALVQHMRQQAADKRCPYVLPYIIEVLQQVLPSNSIVSLDNGLYKIWFARNYLCRYPDSLLLDNALATMGAGFPAAMAAKMVFPKRKVIAVCGDGGFLMNSQDLSTAVRLGLDLMILVLRDNAYGMIKWEQQQQGFANYGVEFIAPDFVQLAQAHGAAGYAVTASTDLTGLLRSCLRKRGVQVIDIPIDYQRDSDLWGESLLKQRTKLGPAASALPS